MQNRTTEFCRICLFLLWIHKDSKTNFFKHWLYSTEPGQWSIDQTVPRLCAVNWDWSDWLCFHITSLPLGISRAQQWGPSSWSDLCKASQAALVMSKIMWETGVRRAALSSSREQLEGKVQIGITFLVDIWPGLFCMPFNMQVLIKSV